ncbi:MAG: sel1 repeat family protein [Pseudanabaena sp. CRU_2_10]|nr:sel1 repeat family protein [Pseudanabaena sp. CRU_2_10]
MARTYDWHEFGTGRHEDRPTALKWYRQAADLNYFPAAYMLYQTYRYGFVGVDRDKAASIKWLRRALELSNGKSKAHIFVDFARFSDPKQNNPDESFSDIPKSAANHLAYLKQAYEINPRDTWVADYYGSSLYDAKRYAEALEVRQNSNNPYTWQKIGQMYEKERAHRQILLKHWVGIRTWRSRGRNTKMNLIRLPGMESERFIA